MISSLYIAITFRTKLHGGAYLRAGIPGVGAYRPYQWLRCSVVDMAEIPGEQIVDAMDRRNCDVQCVGFRTGGNATFHNQGFGQLLYFPVDRQLCDALQCLEAAPGRLGVARGCLNKDELRREQFVIRARFVPPLGRYLLPCSGPYIAAGPCSQIARNRGLNVDGLFHGLQLTLHLDKEIGSGFC